MRCHAEDRLEITVKASERAKAAGVRRFENAFFAVSQQVACLGDTVTDHIVGKGNSRAGPKMAGEINVVTEGFARKGIEGAVLVKVVRHKVKDAQKQGVAVLRALDVGCTSVKFAADGIQKPLQNEKRRVFRCFREAANI